MKQLTAACPHFIRAFRSAIHCQPLTNNSGETISTFASIADRNAYIDDFCACGCWRGCIIAQEYTRRRTPDNGKAAPIDTHTGQTVL